MNAELKVEQIHFKFRMLYVLTVFHHSSERKGEGEGELGERLKQRQQKQIFGRGKWPSLHKACQNYIAALS